MDTQEAMDALRTAIRKEVAAELMRLHDQSKQAARPGLWLAAITLDPSLDPFSTD